MRTPAPTTAAANPPHGAARGRRADGVLRRLAAALAGAALLAGALGVAGVQQPGPVDAPEQVARLLSDDAGVRLQALAALRRDIPAARLALLEALPADPPPDGHWRLAHHLTEFGTAEDVPRLLPLLAQARDGRERAAVLGALRALYRPVAAGRDLSLLVQDFSFVQTRPPRPVADEQAGRWLLTDWSFDVLHRNGLPLAAVRRLETLRGQTFGARRALLEAVQERLGEDGWEAHRQTALLALDHVPRRLRTEGNVHVALRNPLDAPLLLEVDLDVWFGRFETPPAQRRLYLPPGTRQAVELPVVLTGDRPERGVRLDLRLREVDGPHIPTGHKLFLPLLPERSTPLPF